MEIPCPGRARLGGTLLIVLFALALHVRQSDSTFLWTRFSPPQSPISGDPPNGWRPPSLVPDVVLPPPTTTGLAGGSKEPHGNSQDLLRLPQILCGYAASGRWPPYPPYLQAAIVDLGRHVFALDDPGVRQYCARYTRILIVRRPCCAYPGESNVP
ncbi:Dper\GL20610-PA-like protein [Anopheles sinensis]|uniref:Dper\GL20610-PA-like protein n=1 Tax=Anopheles sinensis TaxID=74873 RepID=A0A084W2V4_ANOSI|nr:Dper\GL20610-PA-like protein [Anopheles sinensis]